jgi:hypothetical protein
MLGKLLESCKYDVRNEVADNVMVIRKIYLIKITIHGKVMLYFGEIFSEHA